MATTDHDERRRGKGEIRASARQVRDQRGWCELDLARWRAQDLGDTRRQGAEIDPVRRGDELREGQAVGVHPESIAVGAAPQREVE